MQDQEKDLLQSWLDKLQQESWQLELLISGFAILGLFELKNYISQTMELFYANIHEDLSLELNYGMLVIIFWVTQIFIVNLLIHILVRGLWIGAIGLRYVSGDIDYEQLKYNERFIKYYQRTVGSFDKYIVGLEKISSVIFSFTFLLFFVFISFFLFFVLIALFSFIFDKLGVEDDGMFANIFFITFFVLFALVAFDFITLGLIKRIKQRHFAAFYLAWYKVAGVLTLSFLWRPILLNFLDQKFTKRLLIGVMPYILLVTFIFPNGTIGEYEYFLPIRETPSSSRLEMSTSLLNMHTFNAKFYDDMRKKDKPDFRLIRSISLPSKKVNGSLFEVFVKYTIGIENYLNYQDSTLIKLAKIGYHNSAFGISDYSARTKKEKKEKIKRVLALAGKGINKKRKRAIRDSLNTIFSKESEVAYTKNLLKIKRMLKNEMTFFIDNQPIADSLVSLDFYIHPNAKEKGMLCFFPVDLTLGRHTFSYHKKYLEDIEMTEIDTFKLTIPFIYVEK